MRCRAIGLWFWLFCVGAISLTNRAWSAQAANSPTFDHAHKQWGLLLKQFVAVDGHESRVKYAKLKSDHLELDSYLKTLENVKNAEFSRFSEPQKLAFLINAYNALTIKLILDHYPVKSIKDIGSFLKSAWKIKFFTLLEEKKHLDNIEHDLIRKSFNEPRIHFALVCASNGCPALRPEAFTADELEKQLEEATRNFLNDKARNRYSQATNKLELSSIFKWYGEDFSKKHGSVETFVATRITENPKEQAAIRSKKASISYLDYDWSLNDEK